MRVQIPGTWYDQGGRQMFLAAVEPLSLVKMVAPPKPWNPTAKLDDQTAGNRARDEKHLSGIVNYIEDNESFVIGAAVLYADPKQAEIHKLTGIPGVSEDEHTGLGILSMDIGATLAIGDGQHRIGAYEKIIRLHSEDGDEVLERLSRSGQPVIVVIDGNPLNRAQDFADLQVNVKSPSASMGQSMDRRQPINRTLLEMFRDPELPIFGADGSAELVEVQKDNPGKLSLKLFSFKTVRYVSGLLLVGNAYRSPSTMDKAVNGKLEGENADEAREALVDFWSSLAELVRFADVVDGSIKAPELREATYLTSAGVLYAIAFAVYSAHTLWGVPVRTAVKALDTVNFDRVDTNGREEPMEITSEETPFAGNLIDPDTGKLQAGRTAWETAAKVLLEVIAADPQVAELRSDVTEEGAA